MKLRYKLGGGILLLLLLTVVSAAVYISYDAPCTNPPQVPAGTESMQAATYSCYGSPEVITIGPAAKPQPAADEVLVRVLAAAVNPLDWHYMRGTPYVMRAMGAGFGKPADHRLGVDFAGVVEAVGSGVTRFSPGDRVFGGANGAYAEYLVIKENRAIAKIPSGVAFEQAAAVPIAAITALQAVRDIGQLEQGDRVLVNGASGGVGTYAVQIAKSMGAEVSGVCSTRNVELVTSLGADQVFDYKQENYIESGQSWDLIIDNVGNHALSANRDVMTDNGTLVIVGGSSGDWLGPLKRPIGGVILSKFVEQNFAMLMARLKQDDLETLAAMLAAGDIRSVIDRHYSLQELQEAIKYSESGRARGKIIIDVQ